MPSTQAIVKSDENQLWFSSNKTILKSSKTSIDYNKNNDEEVAAQPYIRLNDGNKMPMLGLGTWNAQGKELKDAVKAAIYCGYRHIDTASNYKNEKLVGDAIQECLNEGVVRREELFITTKLWNNSHVRSSVRRALEKSLKELQLSYVDLYLIHYPIGYQEGDVLSPIDPVTNQVITTDIDYVETWLGMEDVKRANLTRSIGISNFNREQTARILYSCSIKPAINQVECHPYLSQRNLLNYSRANDIILTAYSPLGSPGRIDPRIQDIPFLLEDPLILSLAKKYSRPVAHILIRYQIQRNIVCIPKAIQINHVESNFKSLTFELSKEDLQSLDSLDKNYRFMKFERCLDHKFYPFKEI